MFYQSFRPIDGVLSAFGRRSENLFLVTQRAKRYPGSEVRVWGTLDVVWMSNFYLGLEAPKQTLRPVTPAPIPRAVHRPIPAGPASSQSSASRYHPKGRK